MTSSLFPRLFTPVYAAALLSVVLMQGLLWVTESSSLKITKIPKRDRMDLAMQHEFDLTRDPATMSIPRERLWNAINYAEQLRAASQVGKVAGALSINWTERGPSNVGGRTRAIMVDLNDPTYKTVFSAGVGGGLWKTSDITVAAPVWTPVNDLFSNIAITAICQHPTTRNIIYFGTGEGWFNADAIRGDGIWKSTDGGLTFTQLAATAGLANFRYVNRMIIHPPTGDVYAATNGGLFRSQNGGTTWTEVLGNGNGSTVDFIGDVDLAADNAIIAATGSIFSGADGVYRSPNGNAGTFTKLNTGANGFPTTGFERIEIAAAPSNAAVIYALTMSAATYGVGGIYKTTNSGATWTSCTLPTDADPGIAGEFTRGQAWYDLTIGVDPNDPNTVLVGGIDLFKSTNSGTTWTQLCHWYGGFGYQNVHADQHAIVFQPGSSNVIYFGNDGGIYRTANAGTTIDFKSYNYNITQFYACAMNPAIGSNQFMAGAQDNGTQQYSVPGINTTIEVTGGDGAYCHIDQSDPNYQFSSYVYNNIYRSTDGGGSFASIRANNNGSFINPSDFDDTNNNFYASYTAGNYTRLLNAHASTTWNNIAIAAFNAGRVTAVKVAPVTAHRVFFGLNNGRVVRVDNANAATPTATHINAGAGMPTSASISCIEVEKDDDNHLLVTYSNYGVNSVWETKNGGTTWTSVEGNLPDMPIRWSLFNPSDSSEALLATEVGIWSTDELNGGATVWGPSNSGLANVRTDMLQLRSSDNMIIAATHGRGLYSTDHFSPARADFSADRFVIYTGKGIQFTNGSVKATSWAWNFGDGFTSILSNPAHSYNTPGVYTVSLSINGGGGALTNTKTAYITVLPNRGTPYTIAAGGNFDTNPNDFAGDYTGGTRWQRGNSAVAGKNSTRSGSSAWVTNLTGNYTDNAYCLLYTPNYNFSAAGTYTLNFYRKNNFEIAYDGFRVEYSLNKGDSWTILGTTGAGWYDFANGGGGTAFPVGEPFFNSTQSAFTLATRNVSFLAGNPNVAFRFVFRSDGVVTTPGVALDDFEIIGPSNIPLPVTMGSFTGKAEETTNLLEWTTLSELNNDGFFVQRSAEGNQFEEIGFTKGIGNSTLANNYVFRDENPLQQLLSYYRLRQIDYNGAEKYSKTIAIKRGNEGSGSILVFPMPFKDHINILFRSEKNHIANLKIYNLKGQVVYEQQIITESALFRLPLERDKFESGVYLLSIEEAGVVYSTKLIRSSTN
ncbi:MAG: T9SS type A sorting domain-containing protein [Bacteroidetes bacterium]|nr:T9SS type A sorting domain-containing protein [Bacteroidota bacterium]